MNSTPTRIVAQPEDPELRRHREEMLARWPWLRRARSVAYLVVIVAIAWVLFRTLLG